VLRGQDQHLENIATGSYGRRPPFDPRRREPRPASGEMPRS
jgi:hypothetical protein